MNAEARVRVAAKRGIILLGIFTFVVDALLLAQPLYSTQIYDRVLSSRSIETLLFLSIIIGAATLLLGMVDMVRGMIASRIGTQIEAECAGEAFLASLASDRARHGDVQPLRDVAAVKGFFANRSILAFLDVPCAPLFIGVLYFIHPDLFWLTLGGSVALILLTLGNQFATKRLAHQSNDASLKANVSAQAFARNAESLRAMGMIGTVLRRWGRDATAAANASDRLASVNATFAGISRVVRMGLQLALLGYGGYLVLLNEMSAGLIFAASLISGRALQPIDQAIAGWKGLVDTSFAWKRLQAALRTVPLSDVRTSLPTPTGAVNVDRLVVYPKGMPGAAPILKRISFEVAAGDCLVVVGPSGAGKSTLVRAMVGALPYQAGDIRIDGAELRHWDSEQLGCHMGYLPQDVDLLPGTIAQNISRFADVPDDAAIVEAARMASVHDLVLKLPEGYDTKLGPGGMELSGGQRQRIGLARAFFGKPKLLILDEPNASLDAEGEAALDAAIRAAKEAKVTVILVTQRRPIAERADKLLVVREGEVADFGNRAEVLERQTKGSKPRGAEKASAPSTSVVVPMPAAAPKSSAPGAERSTVGGAVAAVPSVSHVGS